MALDLDQELARRVARRLRARVLQQLGLATPALLAACSGREVSDGDDGGVTTNPSSGFEDTSEAGEAEAEAEAESDTSPETGMETGMVKYDVQVEPVECWSDWYWDAGSIPMDFADCQLGPFDPNVPVVYQQVCVPMPPSGDCSEICVDSWCLGMDECVYATVLDLCGELEIAGECCVLVAIEEPPPVGRPFVVAGAARLAELAQLDASELSPAAAHWLAMAQGEHASVAAFARFVADLLRFGAPANLVADALAAARDEVEHTHAALRLASRLAGRPLALGPLAIAGAQPPSTDLEQAVVAAVIEGCVGETLAAHEAGCLAARASDPEAAAALRQIAADESRHAALAWRFVAWALRTRPELLPAVREAFTASRAQIAAELGATSTAASPTDPGLLALGCPSPGLRLRWRRLAVRELVDPCVAALLCDEVPSPTARA